MRVRALSLRDFRSYGRLDLDIDEGVSTFVGPNGQGKTNLVEAVEYVAAQTSHRASTDAPLVRRGAERAVLRTVVQRSDREAVIELEINPGGANRARLNRGAFVRPRDALSILRTVTFAPADIDLVRGDPSGRRRFLDASLTARQPRYAAVRAEYDRVIRQRNSLLKTAGRPGGRSGAAMSTLDVWDAHAAEAGAELLAGRLALVAELQPHVVSYYSELTAGTPKSAAGNTASLAYSSSASLVGELDQAPDRAALRHSLLGEMAKRRGEELDRGVSLVGPHRDDLVVTLGDMPARGYASHGESWSLALSLRLAAFGLLRHDGDDPVLVLDDVFAELDDIRRRRLAAVIADAEQVLITAAVAADVPEALHGTSFDVRDGEVHRV